jgi:hypothetical protein
MQLHELVWGPPNISENLRRAEIPYGDDTLVVVETNQGLFAIYPKRENYPYYRKLDALSAQCILYELLGVSDAAS